MILIRSDLGDKFVRLMCETEIKYQSIFNGFQSVDVLFA